MSVILQISSGQGPEECRKFVPLLAEIICREAAEQNLRCNLLSAVPGRERGSASLRFAVEGENLPHFRQRWEGTVKWVWQSTIRPHWPRKNWFVKVTFFEFESNDCGSFKLSDLKIETCRASGNGGQHVNTTDTAVRVVHLPSKTEAVASEERSQSRNKALAILRIQEKLNLISARRQAAEKESMWLDHYHLERGSAVRTFKGLPPVEC